MLYVKIQMQGGGTYVQSLSELTVLIDEITEAADCGSVGRKWTVELIEMTPEAHELLGEFEGH